MTGAAKGSVRVAVISGTVAALLLPALGLLAGPATAP